MLVSRFGLIGVLLITIMVAACGPGETASDPQERAKTKSQQGYVYEPVNDIERWNYNKRQEIADQPTTIIWCTSAFDNPSSPMFTVAVVGKLTSGNKRPYPTEVRTNYSDTWNPEIPGPDGMYGSSGEYRYGFGPADQYYDMYNLDTFCTTEPTVWQRESTTLVLGTDPVLSDAQQRAQPDLDAAYAEDLAAEEAKNAGDTGAQAQHEAAAAQHRANAQAILEEGITAAGGN